MKAADKIAEAQAGDGDRMRHVKIADASGRRLGRSFAVKQWLEKQAPVNFPKGRVRVHAKGQEDPVAPNSTPQGRAQNRRVEVVLGTTGS